MRPTILVGLGGSGGWQALAWATDEAIGTGAGLVLLWMRKYPQVPVKCAVYGGRPLPGLMRAAHGARLLVVGDNGHGQFGPAGRALLGSVAHGALDQATGPVAVVRPLQDGASP